MDYYTFLKPALFELEPELAHGLAIAALKMGAVPGRLSVEHKTVLGGTTFLNPVGIAPGFDKNGEVVAALFNQGAGFVECGTVTPLPQLGNPKPHLFRLREDEAIINRMGFNNAGLAALLKNLDRQKKDIQKAQAKGAKLGINIGKNKDSENAAVDYVTMLAGVYHHADYITLNISSPNTPGLRDLQSGAALNALLDAVCSKREMLAQKNGKIVPLWLKLAPDLSNEQAAEIVEIIAHYPLAALVIGNTTLSRPETLKSSHKNEQGGLSGKPLMELSTQKLRLFHTLTEGKIPLVGVGGIASPEDAVAKIQAGATLVQLYSALVYQGFGLIHAINKRLIATS